MNEQTINELNSITSPTPEVLVVKEHDRNGVAGRTLFSVAALYFEGAMYYVRSPEERAASKDPHVLFAREPFTSGNSFLAKTVAATMLHKADCGFHPISVLFAHTYAEQRDGTLADRLVEFAVARRHPAQDASKGNIVGLAFIALTGFDEIEAPKLAYFSWGALPWFRYAAIHDTYVESQFGYAPVAGFVRPTIMLPGVPPGVVPPQDKGRILLPQ